MSTSEIIRAYEEGLITRGEAAEQAQVDDVEALYQRIGNDRRHGGSSRFSEASARAGH